MPSTWEGPSGSSVLEADRTLTLLELAECRPNPHELQVAGRRLGRKAVCVGLLATVGYAGLVFVAHGPLTALAFAAVLVVALIATGTCVMHDANHGAFGSRGMNRALGYSADLLGASSWLWRLKHNVIHHGNTNVVGIDTDIEQMPFARLAPGQAWRPWHRYQHIYMWGLYGFLTVQWMLLSDFGSLLTRHIGSQPTPRRPRRRDVALLLVGKVAHVGWALALPFVFHRWWVVLTFYLACSWLVGFVLAVFFQVAHCVEEVDFAEPGDPRRGNEFAGHQLRTTANVACRTPIVGRPIAWLMGGLHQQIEHHLAPGLPHTAYPAMADRVRRLCSARHVDYHVHKSLWAAIRSHARWLHLMGRPVSTPRS